MRVENEDKIYVKSSRDFEEQQVFLRAAGVATAQTVVGK